MSPLPLKKMDSCLLGLLLTLLSSHGRVSCERQASLAGADGQTQPLDLLLHAPVAGSFFFKPGVLCLKTNKKYCNLRCSKDEHHGSLSLRVGRASVRTAAVRCGACSEPPGSIVDRRFLSSGPGAATVSQCLA